MPASKYTEDERKVALDIYEKSGAAEAARQTGIPKPTITSWARRAGLQSDAPQNHKAAIEMSQLSRLEKQERLTDLMVDEAIRTVQDMNSPITVAGAFSPVKLPKPEPRHRKDLAVTLGVLFDKVQLATGGATNRTEIGGKDEIAAMMVGARMAFDVADERAGTTSGSV